MRSDRIWFGSDWIWINPNHPIGFKVGLNSDEFFSNPNYPKSDRIHPNPKLPTPTLRYFLFHLDPKYHHCSVNNLKIIYAVNIKHKFSDLKKKVKYNLINKRTKLVLLFLFRFNIIEYACDEPT